MDDRSLTRASARWLEIQIPTDRRTAMDGFETVVQGHGVREWEWHILKDEGDDIGKEQGRRVADVSHAVISLSFRPSFFLSFFLFFFFSFSLFSSCLAPQVYYSHGRRRKNSGYVPMNQYASPAVQTLLNEGIASGKILDDIVVFHVIDGDDLVAEIHKEMLIER